ncbi:MAG: threonine synthase [Lutibacter sp.]
MEYYSLNHKAPNVSFEDAIINGLAPDNGLYFPNEIKPLPKSFFQHIEYFSNEEIAYEVIKQFVGTEIKESDLKKIIKEALNFDFPLVKIKEDCYSLELYHGPTLAFKDVGARFMARFLGYFNKKKKHSKITVLVATSGDTGGAVADGFYNVDGINVVILYPSGKVSEVQEKQLTTLGNNVKALEVNGTFDDCQKMVKTAFVDTELTKNVVLTSANSINVARWLPQMFYFFFAYKQLKNKNKPIAVSVPSGNFGNICAGLMAQQLGLNIKHFVAATNVNKTVPVFMETGNYEPHKAIATISNAMDVADPSNFVRILEIFNKKRKNLSKQFSSFSFSDEETKKTIKFLNTHYNYTADPHGAVGFLGLDKYLKNKPNYQGIFLETAHPVKFLDVVEKEINSSVAIPNRVQKVLKKEKIALPIDTYGDLKDFLLSENL